MLPDPPYPLVYGCKEDQYCVIEAQQEGHIVCSLLGVRPEVDLDMTTFLKSESNKITFYEKQLKVKTNQETYDITLTTKYKIEELSLSRLTLECTTSNTPTSSLELSTKFDLIFIEGVLTLSI